MGTNDIDPALVETLSHLAWEASQQSAYTRWQDAESDDDQPPVVGWEDRAEEQREDTRAGVRSILRALRRRNMLAPAVPAEAETKAERPHPELWMVESGAHRFYAPTEDGAWAIAKTCSEFGYKVHPPVVPAPNEIGPWQRIEDVPEGVYGIRDKEGGLWRRWGVCEWQFLSHTGSGIWGSPVQIPRWCAPFVAAEERRA
ncbi:hypothetical protein EEB13_05420 [Rhodococcus sp. WS3]|uniref:hypothetical protein n=1 Tax=Rhodococcus sp. WS3 TaxID=2486271 RepID=UPI00114310FE|nr:hypothetical protein [Rhodococcus sp. WS3]ROZ49365.1 hypothetical protein EEB13_05420 [Rhodococcus sp. WS3]